jgi:predicted CXXCH cytochrome family protein
MCHPRKDFLGTSTHQPVNEGRCLRCHDPHGSAESSLLTSAYSEERWLTKGEKDYALCIECHEAAPLIESGSKSKTGFSNEGVNLHWLHISKKGSSSSATSRSSGINCHNCHDPHSAQEEHLIRRELNCGGVLCLKLNYRITSNGGECRSGCHGRQSYSRTAVQSDGPDSIIRPSDLPP